MIFDLGRPFGVDSFWMRRCYAIHMDSLRRKNEASGRYSDMGRLWTFINKRFTSLQWMGTVAFVVLGIVISIVGLQ